MIKTVVNKYGQDKCYISFSGGKDSTVLSYLVDMAIPGNTIRRVYCNTGIDYKIIVRFVKDLADHDERFVIIKPKVPIVKMLKQDGYPFKSKHHSEMVQIYQNNNKNLSAAKYRDGLYNFSGNICPKVLRYQLTDGWNSIKISDKCCFNLKEHPLQEYEHENGMKVAMVAIMREEGGRRESAKCLAKYPKGMIHFHPMAVVTKQWENWLIDKYRIRLCDIYYPPYSFTRTGCKGCPFAIDLQRNLDVMAKYFPDERRQCEIIWKPVYDEYRKIGYRLKKYEQMTIDDY